MGCASGIVRSLISLVLGVVIFVAFLGFLLASNFSDKLLSADLYIDTLAEENAAGKDAYDRIYDEVLLDPELKETTKDLLGDIKVVSQEDVVQILRLILPPEYIQSQVEGAIHDTVDYLNEDTDTLELFIELAPRLANAKDVLFAYIDRRIDNLELEDTGVPDCTPGRVIELANRYVTRWRELAQGQLPTSVPSLESLTQECRTAIFDLAYPSLLQDDSLDDRTTRGLVNSRPDIEREFNAGNTHGVLKQAVRPLATPLIDDAFDQLRERLDEQDRLDIIHQIAAWNTDLTEDELGDDIDDVRTWVNRSQDYGKTVTLALVIIVSFILAMVQFPSLTNGLRWSGLTLVLTGGFFFVLGKVLESQVPDRLADLVERGAEEVTAIPPSVTILGGDLLSSFGKSITEGFAGPSLALIVICAALFGASFLVFLLRPFIPVIR